MKKIRKSTMYYLCEYMNSEQWLVFKYTSTIVNHTKKINDVEIDIRVGYNKKNNTRVLLLCHNNTVITKSPEIKNHINVNDMIDTIDWDKWQYTKENILEIEKTTLNYLENNPDKY